MSESGEQFLHKKDSKLHTTPAVEHEQGRRRIANALSEKREKINSGVNRKPRKYYQFLKNQQIK